jgi:transglutaminase-like putative cysteine protease
VTATVAPPSAPAAPPEQPPAASPRVPSRPAASPTARELAAVAALTLYSMAVALGFARVFSGWEFFADLALLAVVGHGLSWVLRRLRVHGLIAMPLTALALVWLLLRLHYTDTLRWGMAPGGATWDRIEIHLDLFRDRFPTAVAPVDYGAEWATLAGVAVVLAVVMSDAFAFRADARGESLVPGGVLFVFIAALGKSRLQVLSTVVLVAAGVVAVIALRAFHDRSRRVELRAAGSGGSFVVPAALSTAVLVAVAGGVVGPRLPGADAEPLIDTKGRSGGVTEVVSPLVDIRSRLTSRSNVEMFKVEADAEDYWRSTTLPEFDGTTFGLPTRSLERVDGSFGPGADDGQRIVQQVQVLALRGPLIPAAAEPYQADGFSDGERIEIKRNDDTSTLLIDGELATGDVFTIVSSSPQLTPDELRATTTANAPDEVFTALPDDFPDEVAEITAAVTAGASTQYDRAIALQNWFRSEFDYSTEVQSGHGTSAILSFLAERIGYCEQFSASFAAMARTLGMPSRVAVGYTSGVRDGDGWFVVRGKNAHAWPELWFDGIGWIAFEPTPGRGAPGDESYTGVEPAQDDSPATSGGGGGETSATAPPTPPPTILPPATTAAPAPGDSSATTTVAPGGLPGQLPSPDGGLATPTSDASEDGTGFPWPWLVAGLLLLVLLAGPAVIRRWHSRSARAHGSADRVQAAWSRARTAAIRAGVVGTGSMTTAEWAAATAAELPVAARPMRALADVVDRVSFAPPGTVDLDASGRQGATIGHDCELWSTQVDRIATDTLTPWQRVRHYFTDWR